MKTPAIAYLRTSSAANVGGDSDQRQREAIQAYAARSDLEIAAEFYDAAVSGADPIDQRKGFTDLLAWATESGVKTVVVENASRFARDLIVQETGYALLTGQGFTLIAADDPDAFTGDTPTAKMVRQILGAVAEFEKANLVAKLKGARDRAAASAGKRVEGRKGYDDTNPELVREAKRLSRKNPKTGKVRSLREIAGELAALGHTTATGKPFSAAQVKRLLDY
ncbi:recombinase family protein [Azospirillum sp. TSO35-2]|uniref:recombinase family protein n=1 Tax=Azospirillum sp. TSO35-2 TaxID=716796 RepID=UPI000D6069ED|nr:recombinase family protein [Azospirillum sp. TSO35-2]PWC32587.1 serine recombinase [Azospirillum sp. TSO35-2]